MKSDPQFNLATDCPRLQLGEDGIFYATPSEAISYPEEGKCRNSGLWDSLNFITSPWIKKICIRNRLVVSFEKGILHRTLCRPEEDPEFLKRQSNSCFCRRRRIPIHCWAIRFDQMGLIRPNFK